MSDPVFMTRDELDGWIADEREVIANEIKYAPAYAAMLGETRIRNMRAAHAHLLTPESNNG